MKGKNPYNCLEEERVKEKGKKELVSPKTKTKKSQKKRTKGSKKKTKTEKKGREILTNG
jgi:hypothetical protein